MRLSGGIERLKRSQGLWVEKSRSFGLESLEGTEDWDCIILASRSSDRREKERTSLGVSSWEEGCAPCCETFFEQESLTRLHSTPSYNECRNSAAGREDYHFLLHFFPDSPGQTVGLRNEPMNE